FWYDGMEEQPEIPGVPAGEILGDLPRRRPAGQGQGRQGQAQRESQIIGQVFSQSYFSDPPPPPAAKKERRERQPDDPNERLDARVNRLASAGSNGRLFVGEKGLITTGTYGENTRLLPVEKMKDYHFPSEFLTRS